MKTLDLRNETTRDAALLLLRGITGAVFTFHGAQKLFGAFGGPGLDGFAGYLGTLGLPLPYANALLAGGAEFLGGLALLAGLGVGFAAVPLTITMLVATFALRAGGFDSQKGGFEFPLTLAVLSVAIGLLGAGRFSLSSALRNARVESAKVPVRQPSLS